MDARVILRDIRITRQDMHTVQVFWCGHRFKDGHFEVLESDGWTITVK
jgi:hypothetical protein